MSTPRYIYREEPIAEEQARVARLRQISNELEEIERRKEQIKECENYIAKLRKEPLDTTIKVCVTLRPGDEGYDAAPVRFEQRDWKGEFTWKNLPTT
jgi:hypothetical protein|tara:strand:+ start:217 stop:507 length:291 start_codon:yes stop_codon:yes gene_type:complete